MNPMDDPPIIIEPRDTATSAVVWLHGLGASGDDFEPVVPYLGPVVQRTRFIFPHAPNRPVTINGGMVMRAWYDVFAMDIGRQVDEAGIIASAALATALVQEQIDSGIGADRIVLAGFSQGGAIALHAGARFPQALAGIMGLSTYLAIDCFDSPNELSANQETEIFLAHGLYDPVLPLQLAEQSRAKLEANGYQVRWSTYPMEHSVSPEQLADIANWLGAVLPS